MPHIVDWRERRTLVKPKCQDWSIDLERKYKPIPAISTERPWFDARHSTETLFQIIEDIIDRTLPQITNEFFDQFIDVKEVPYGRHNSDTNH